MADLTPGVLDELVRLMNGEIEPRGMDKAALYRLANALVPDKARELLHRTLAELNDQGETFAQIGDHLGVHEATAARWAKPPAEDRRRRRAAGEQ